jgi:hypothetical protein
MARPLADVAASPSMQMQQMGVATGMCRLAELRDQVQDLLQRELYESAVIMVRFSAAWLTLRQGPAVV